ncbi:MAG TPA: hypothetical protein VFJ06_00585 [Halococcus sp.]|nr:hypothetical protein [Halococcus sp.]
MAEETKTNPEGRDINREGRYVQKVTTEDVLDLFDEVRGPVLVASDIADAYDCSPETARRRLRDLAADRKVEKREARNKILWWRTDDTDTDMDSEDSDVLAGLDPDVVFKRLSNELNEPITVGDTVYEDGDEHPARAENYGDS